MKVLASFLGLFLIFSASSSMANDMAEYNDIPDYLGTNIVPLTKKELQALRLTGNFAAKGLAPFMGANGKLMYVHGASMVTILASPMNISDMELEIGESVNEIIVGDNARWMVETGQAGNTTHVFFKPIDAGLETTAVITTDRRVYHVRLISQRSGFTPYIGFVYTDKLSRYTASKNQAQAEKDHKSSTVIDGQRYNLADLNFKYKVKGSASWRPERVYDDKRQTFIRLPKDVQSNEIPILLVRKGDQNIMVNYRITDQAMIVDGVFKEIVLLLGVGSDQEKVTIEAD